MKVVVTGGTGFIGAALVRQLLDAGSEVAVLTRGAETPGKAVKWVPGAQGDWEQALDGADAVVNLAGKNLFENRWNPEVKGAIRSSRIDVTRQIVAAIGRRSRKPRVLVSASAIGYYGPHGDEELDEGAAVSGDYLGALAADWEKEAAAAEAMGVRVVRVRIGVVLHPSGGALAQMVPPFRRFIGGPIGSGQQWFSWITREDLLSVLRFAIDGDLRGPVNATAPNPVRLGEFCKALGAAIGRPSWFPVPGFMARMMLGEVAEIILTGQRVVPRALQKAGFTFKHAEVGPALAALFSEST